MQLALKVVREIDGKQWAPFEIAMAGSRQSALCVHMLSSTQSKCQANKQELATVHYQKEYVV